MNKRTWISLGIVIVVVFGLFFNFFLNGSDDPKPVSSSSPSPSPSTAPSSSPTSTPAPGNVDTVNDVLTPYVINNNYGQLYQAYSLNEHDYLVESQFAGGEYDNEFPSNLVLMMRSKDGKVTVDQLNSGNYLVHLFKENNSPFLTASKSNQTRLVIFYEVSTLNRFPQKGYVYEVKEDGSLSLVYETVHTFESLTRSSSGELLLTEKEYDDNKNKYPTAFKPYYLHGLTYKNGTFTSVSKTHVDPNTSK